MRDVNDEQLTLIMTVMRLLDKPATPHQVRVAYHKAAQELQVYKLDSASQNPVDQ